MLAFQNDKSADVRKFLVGFMEEAWYDIICRKSKVIEKSNVKFPTVVIDAFM